MISNASGENRQAYCALVNKRKSGCTANGSTVISGADMDVINEFEGPTARHPCEDLTGIETTDEG